MLKVLYVEFDTTHKENFVFDLPEGQNSWLLILTHTPAEFLVDDIFIKMPPNALILYKPGQRIFYRASEKRYGNDWIRFETDEEYVTQTPVPSGIPFTMRDTSFLHKLYQLITAEHERDGVLKDVITDKLLQVMFHKLSEAFDDKPATLMYRNLYDLRNQVYKRPYEKWTIKGMAEKLSISSGHLEKIYKNTFGLTCMEDVINSRISLAKKLLKSSDYSIAEIIPLCGYRNVEHFYRQFKKMTGMTPKSYQSLTIHTREQIR